MLLVSRTCYSFLLEKFPLCFHDPSLHWSPGFVVVVVVVGLGIYLKGKVREMETQAEKKNLPSWD